MHLVIIGGSDAGIAAALRARELDPAARITVLLADDYPNFSICGLPYFLSGEVPDWSQLAHRTDFPGIDIKRGHRARSINPHTKRIIIEQGGSERGLDYDRLIIATGAVPVRPDFPGNDLPGVHVLHSMADSFAVQDHLTARPPGQVVVVGAGYIGLEMAEAFRRRGFDVTLISRSIQVMPTVEPDLGILVATELERHGIAIVHGASVARIEPGLRVHDDQGGIHDAELVLLAAGVRPASRLARDTGIALGNRDAIVVTEHMETNLPDIFAAGDCVETRHRLLSKPTWISLGTIAHKQGRIAGENAVRGGRAFAGIVGTQSLKLFDRVIARTGLLTSEAEAEGYSPLTVNVSVPDHTQYYPGASELRLRLTGDTLSGRLLGLQIVGHRDAEVSKRIDIAATAIFQGASIEALNDLDLSYTPPLNTPWDPIQQAAQLWSAARSHPSRIKHLY